ncbi:MAG: DUF2855 family protein [Aggregatilineales bacterium]
MSIDFLVERKNLQNTKFIEQDADFTLEDGQVLCEIDQFAFTANNITYAVAGDFLKYWHFFPAAEDGWGRVPVWGFATITESKHPEIEVGEKLYGYFPMSTYLVITAGNVRARSFSDVADHRSALSMIYNTYTRVSRVADGGYDNQALNALLRPMFTTSFLLDDFAMDNDFFGAKDLILSSASSKTGYGTAFLLHRNRSERSADYRIIGLTSPRNMDFVKSLGCYDEVYPYEQATALTPEDCMYLDFAGNGALRLTIHEHYGNKLKYDCAIGMTHHEQRGAANAVPGVKPELFFAPAQYQKRVEEWGAAQYHTNMNTAWLAFLEKADDWMDIVLLSGQDAISETYHAMLAGDVPAQNGYMLKF